ncbi:MAG: V-type ATP synthase subunit F [Ruminococcus sp.]|nr:V-type ATP synthase subunit F [Ruminococcus sp.]MBQ9515614.1 V-type ATP synthase subunit F [Ruminococcus sp.]
MRMYLLSDNVDTLIGMRMSGVEGVVLHEEHELREKLDQLMKEDDIAVIMITATLMNLIRETVYDLKLNVKQPLIIEIPDRHGNGRTKDSITKYVKDAIGVNMS